MRTSRETGFWKEEGRFAPKKVGSRQIYGQIGRMVLRLEKRKKEVWRMVFNSESFWDWLKHLLGGG